MRIVPVFIKYTDSTITSPAAFRKELSRVKQKGYSIDDEEEELGVRCLAAPVFNPLGEVTTALSVTGTTAQIPSESVDKLAEKASAAVSSMSADEADEFEPFDDFESEAATA